MNVSMHMLYSLYVCIAYKHLYTVSAIFYHSIYFLISHAEVELLHCTF